jgi:hypothetical protein
MIREKLATIFHLRPEYGVQEHIPLITAVNCSAKRNVKQGTRKSFPQQIGCKESSQARD